MAMVRRQTANSKRQTANGKRGDVNGDCFIFSPQDFSYRSTEIYSGAVDRAITELIFQATLFWCGRAICRMYFQNP
jgi:hypothetical protein